MKSPVAAAAGPTVALDAADERPQGRPSWGRFLSDQGDRGNRAASSCRNLVIATFALNRRCASMPR